MANIKSKEKRNRQSEKSRIKNSRVKSSIRTAAKTVNKLIDSKEEKDLTLINEKFKLFVTRIDAAAQKGIVHKNTAARKKSRLAHKIKSLTVQAG